ncbi:restriction endonuclease subunit S [Cryobacterium sp. M25]|uniref:restriction endonuclease subunit S n=1 Tax=Cryobacterium sp. M25 TaxID=2048293 RepID=UPI000CE55C05|nr:restriction endonuclease subunit S [Cryobacterium sp. M25]
MLNALLAYPLRSGVTVSAASRGSGIKMLNMGELFKYPRIPDVDMARVDLTGFDEERILLRPRDLMFARRSLTLEGAGKCSIVAQINEPTTWESSIIRARLDPSIADARFYFYYFSSPVGRRQMETIVEQVAAAGIRLTELGKLFVPFPELPAQQRIAEVLGALDDKIAANIKLVGKADDFSQALFKSLVNESASAPLSTTARFVNGKAFTKGASGAGRVVIRIAELNSGIGGSTVFSDATVGDDFLARPGDILFAWSGSLTLHRWFRPEGIVNQHIFKVIPNGYPSWLVYELIRSRLAYFKGVAADKATTMGHILRGHLDELVDVPTKSAIGRVDALMTSVWDRTLLAERENETLAATRDALLPQLMSGKLRVRDAEKVLEGVL